jgi:hypothetical protein
MGLAKEAIFGLDLAARLSEASDREYVEHLKQHKTNLQLYESHRDDLYAQRAIVRADRDYLQAVLTPPGPERNTLKESARQSYRKAIVGYARVILQYYTLDEVAAATFPAGVTRATFSTTFAANIDQVTPEQIVPILANSIQLTQQNGWPLSEEVGEYMRFIRRADQRLRHLDAGE